MKTMSLKLLMAAALLSTALSGCIGVSGEFRSIRNDILDNIDGNFKKEIEFGVGPLGIGIASSIVAISNAEDYVDNMMRQVSGVQIGVWENRTRYGEMKINTSILKKLSQDMAEKGWDYIVRTIDRDEMAMVFIRSDYIDTIEELFVIALNDDELVMAELQGDLGELVSIAIRENGLKIHMAKN